MLYWIFVPLEPWFQGFNLFRYISFRAAFAAILFAGFAVRLGIAWRGGLPASMLLGAIVASALWASAVAAALAFADGPAWWTAARVLDVARIGAWLAFRTPIGPAGLWWGLVAGLALVGLILLARAARLLHRGVARVDVDDDPADHQLVPPLAAS